MITLSTAKRLYKSLDDVNVIDDETEEEVIFEFVESTGKDQKVVFPAGTYIYDIWTFLENQCNDFCVYNAMYTN